MENKTEEKKFSVTKNGVPLDENLYTWDKKTKTFSTKEEGLVLDFKNRYDCTFDTGYGCTFDTDHDCTFDTGSGCVVVRRDIFEVHKIPKDTIITLAPYSIPGYIQDGYYYENGEKQYKAIVADGILSQIISKKTVKNMTVYKVKNYGKENESYLVFDGANYSHGTTFEEAKDSLIYKLSDRDTSKFKEWNLDTKITLKQAIEAYRAITGACEAGTRYFCENHKLPKTMTVKKMLELTEGQYNHNKIVEFFK